MVDLVDSEGAKVANMLDGKNVLMIIAPNDFRDEELLEPQRILTEAGAKVVVASTKAGEAKGMLGATVTPSTTVDKENASKYGAVVVVGGMGSPEHLWENEQVHKLLQDALNQHKVVAGICLSGAVLAKAGVLRGCEATVWATPESTLALEQGGATYKRDHVVHDGNVVTADGPEAAKDFAQAIIKAMSAVKV
jgi:protease I